MPIIFNNNENPDYINIDNQEVKKVILNNETIWQPGFYYKIENNTLYVRRNVTAGYTKYNSGDGEIASWNSFSSIVTEEIPILPSDCHNLLANQPLVNVDIHTWNVSNVTNMNHLFGVTKAGYISSLNSVNLSGWDTSNVDDMGGLFDFCTSLTAVDVSNWDTSNVTKMNGMFYSCSSLTSLDLSSFTTPKVVSLRRTFEQCSSLVTIYGSNWNTSNVTDDTALFGSCNNLIGGNNTHWSSSDIGKEMAKLDEVGSPGYFTLKV